MVVDMRLITQSDQDNLFMFRKQSFYTTSIDIFLGSDITKVFWSSFNRSTLSSDMPAVNLAVKGLSFVLASLEEICL